MRGVPHPTPGAGGVGKDRPKKRRKKKRKIIVRRDLRFTWVRLRNWKNFGSAEVGLQGRVFLVGPNASGKSNFLDVFRFLRDLGSPGGGLQVAVQRRGGVKALRSLVARRNPNVEIGVAVDQDQGDDDRPPRWRYLLAFNQRKDDLLPRIIQERVEHLGEVLLERPDRQDQDDPERLTQTHLEQVNMNLAFRELARFFSTIRYLHIVPQLVREPERVVARERDPYGSDFLEQIALTPDKERNARLRRLGKALRITVPQLTSIKFERDELGRPHLLIKHEHWRPRGAWQGENQLSDGTLRLLGVLWALMEQGGPLLLEEPELSLHPGVVRRIPQLFALAREKTGRQVLVSTHSPDLLLDEGIGLDEVLLFRPAKEGTTITPADSLAQIEDLLAGGLTLGEVVIPQTQPQGAEGLPWILD